MHGWIGKILRVDLTTRKLSDIPISDYVPRMVGGWGIMGKIAWDELSPEIGALDPENRLMFMTGPLTGTLVPGTGRGELATVSPTTYSFKGPTEDYVRSGMGGQWAPELKFAGYDGIVVQGKADQPVWISILDEKVEIRDGRKLWGLDTYATQEAIWKELGSKKVKVMCIGPAGERLIRYATIANDNGHHSGIGGTGTVMGSKNLKAIAIRGTGSVSVARPEELYDLALRMRKYRSRPEARPPFILYGASQHRVGHGGKAKNKAEIIEHWKKDTLKAKGCWGCPVACQSVFSVPDGIRSGIANMCAGISRFRKESREYYGRYTTNYVKAVGLFDGMGINCQEIETIIKWLQGCYKAGYLREKETGISMKNFGSYEFFENLIQKIVNREGFGEVLAEGVRRGSASIGDIGKEFVEDVNRGFSESYTPRLLPTSALLAAFGSSARLTLIHTWAARVLLKHAEEPMGRGWLSNEEWVNRLKEIFGTTKVIDHSDEGVYQPDKAYLAKWTEDYKTAGAGCFILCDSVMGSFWSWYSDEPNFRESAPENESRAFSLVTGIDMDTMGMLRVGERVRNVERAIMVREGRRREDDTLAAYCFDPSNAQKAKVPGPDGHWIEVKRAIDREKWEKLKDAYYAERGWDPVTGIPTHARLEDLDLRDIADDLERL